MKMAMEIMKMRPIRYLQREKKTEKKNKTKGSSSKPKSKLKKRSGCDIVKGTPGLLFEARFIKNELEAFLLYLNEDMISRIVEKTNEKMHKVHEKINADEFQFCYSDTNEAEIKIICDSCEVVVVFTFILELAVINVRAILKYNKANYDDTRRIFSQNLAISLMILYIKLRIKVKNLKSV